MNITVKVQSNLIRHGQSEVRTSNGVGALGKLEALLGSNKSQSGIKKSNPDVRRKINEVNIPYLENTSSTRSHIVFDGTFTGDLKSLRKYAYALANLAEVDFNQRKLDYKDYKQSLQDELSKSYDLKVLPAEVSKLYQQKLHKKSFLIWKHQITFIIWDTNEFLGGTYDKVRKVWVAATITKSVYTEKALTSEQLISLESGSLTNTKKVNTFIARAMIRDIKNGKIIYRFLKPDEDLDDFI